MESPTAASIRESQTQSLQNQPCQKTGRTERCAARQSASHTGLPARRKQSRRKPQQGQGNSQHRAGSTHSDTRCTVPNPSAACCALVIKRSLPRIVHLYLDAVGEELITNRLLPCATLFLRAAPAA